jgi:Reverse transcriptase (RNA-dependent DNA polymerase)
MYFGLMNSPATFQTMMNLIMQDLINQGAVVVYIDNILIFMMTEEEHDIIVEEVLKQLEENDLFLKLEKCVFKEREVEFLGLYIGPDGIKMGKVKTKAITEWPTP